MILNESLDTKTVIHSRQVWIKTKKKDKEHLYNTWVSIGKKKENIIRSIKCIEFSYKQINDIIHSTNSCVRSQNFQINSFHNTLKWLYNSWSRKLFFFSGSFCKISIIISGCLVTQMFRSQFWSEKKQFKSFEQHF